MRTLLVFAVALGGCGTQTSGQPLLSTSRIVVAEKVSVDIHVDVPSSADFEVSAASSDALMIDKLSTPGFSILPSCDATHGPDETYEVVVTAAGRKETLEVVATNDVSILCFHHVELTFSSPFGITPGDLQLACADVTGDAGLEVVVSGPASPWFVSLTPELPAVLELQPSGAAPGAWRRVFAQETAQGMQIYGLAAKDNSIYALVDDVGNWKGTGTVLSTATDELAFGVAALRRPTTCKEDCLTNPACCPDTWAALIQETPAIGPPQYGLSFASMDGSPATTAVPLGGEIAGEAAALTPLSGSQLAIGAFGSTETTALAGFAPVWPNTGPPTSGLIGPVWSNSAPLYNPNPNFPPELSIATRTGMTTNDVFAAVLADDYDNALMDVPVSSLAMGNGGSVLGGARSVAAVPDGSMLVAADQGAVLNHDDEHGIPREDLVDLAEREPGAVPHPDYGTAIAPCLSRTGALVGFAVVTAQYDQYEARVAYLPGLP